MGNSIASMSMNRYDGNLKMDHPEKRIPVADANAIITVIRYAARGPRGPVGPRGPAGTQGPAGNTGPAGPQGPVGETSPDGSKSGGKCGSIDHHAAGGRNEPGFSPPCHFADTVTDR